MPLKFKSLPDSAIYLNVSESEIVALAAGGVLPVHFRHYGRAGLFALVGIDCLTTVPSSDFIEAGIYRSMFNPMVVREAPMEVYLPTTAMLSVDPPRSVPVGQIMARVDEISRELDNSDIESGRWLFSVVDLDEAAKTLAPTSPEYQVGSTQPAGPNAEPAQEGARQDRALASTDGLVAWQAVMLESWPEIMAAYKNKPTARNAMQWLKDHGPRGVIPVEQPDRDALRWIDRDENPHVARYSSITKRISEWRDARKIPAKK